MCMCVLLCECVCVCDSLTHINNITSDLIYVSMYKLVGTICPPHPTEYDNFDFERFVKTMSVTNIKIIIKNLE